MATLQCPLDPIVIRNWIGSPPSGFLQGLKVIEEHVSSSNTDCRHPPLKDVVLKGSLEGSTLLLLACNFGQLDAVKHIVECWGVDVRAAAIHYIDPLEYHYRTLSSDVGEATPLFVAALNCHTEVVRYLLEKGADISALTSSTGQHSAINCGARIFNEQDEAVCQCDGLTPLHGALSPPDLRDYYPYYDRIKTFKKRNDIVRLLLKSGADPSALPPDGTPIWIRPFCGVDAITELVYHGMSLNQRNSEGKTVLHHWASSSVGQLHDAISGEGSTLAVVKLLVDKGADLSAQDDEGFTPLLIAASGNEREGRKGVLPNLPILDYLLESDSISRMDKIDAMELAGAVILIDYKTDSQFQTAFRYWIRAQPLVQLLEAEGSHGLIHNTRLLKLKSGRTLNWLTLDELGHILHQHPSEWKIHSSRVLLRVLSNKGWSTVQSLFRSFFYLSIFHHLESQRRFVELLDLLWAMLETINRFEQRVYELSCLTNTVISHLVWILETLGRESHPLLHIKTFQTSLELILATCQIHSRAYPLYGTSQIRLVAMLAAQPHMQTKDVLDILFQLVRLNKRDQQGRTLLHTAVTSYHELDHLFDIIRLLLQAEADPDVGDSHGDGPLHILARSNHSLVDSSARLLMDFGAHLNRINNKGKTVVDVWIENDNRRNGRKSEDRGAVDLPSWCLIVPKLSCLCARNIRLCQVPYSCLPSSLCGFVKKHHP